MHKDGITGCQTVFDVAPRYLIPVSNEHLRKEML
jgi:diaminopimelate dehydrogenase